MIFSQQRRPLLLIALLTIVNVEGASAGVAKCGNSQRGVLILQDFIRHPLGHPEKPPLPSGVDPQVLPVTVSLRITVDRRGTVIHVCVVNQGTSPSKSVRLLNEAAKSSVEKWRYPKDFGLTGDLHLSHQYAQGIVSFEFVKRNTRQGRSSPYG